MIWIHIHIVWIAPLPSNSVIVNISTTTCFVGDAFSLQLLTGTGKGNNSWQKVEFGRSQGPQFHDFLPLCQQTPNALPPNLQHVVLTNNLYSSVCSPTKKTVAVFAGIPKKKRHAIILVVTVPLKVKLTPTTTLT